MIRRWRVWWSRRRSVIDECQCGKGLTERERHLVVATFGDDATLGVGDGGTMMSAAFCAQHCPGGCRRGCVTSRV